MGYAFLFDNKAEQPGTLTSSTDRSAKDGKLAAVIINQMHLLTKKPLTKFL
jgi:hypothetical protein